MQLVIGKNHDGTMYFKVNEEGMSGDRIMIGDIVLIDLHVEVCPFDIAAISHESKMMLRRVRKIGQIYIATPSNPELSPEFLTNIVIIGKVIKNIIMM